MTMISGCITLPNGRSVVEAIYTPPPLQLEVDYGGNPYIEALPPVMSKEDVYKYLTPSISYKKSERQASKHIRLHCIYRLFDYFQPYEHHYLLENKISTAIRRGYIKRNPCDPAYAAEINRSYQELKKGIVTSGSNRSAQSGALGFTFLGISGVGKTVSLSRILSSYPQVIAHSEYNGTRLNKLQLTWLKIDCDQDGSIKGIGENFFEQADSLLSTTYFQQFANSDYKARRIVPALRHVARTHGLGVLVVDEIQNLSRLKSGGANRMVQFFLQLRNEVGVPIILVGTPNARPILEKTFATARRGCSQGFVSWKQMPCDAEWALFVEGMWRYQWTKEKTELSDELRAALYFESQGILDVAVKLFALTQCAAIVYTNDELITSELLRNVAKESLSPLQPMLEALRNKDEDALAEYGDIEINFNAEFSKYKTEIEGVETTTSVNQSEHALIAQIANRLSIIGIEISKAYPAILQAIQMFGSNEKDADRITQEAAKIAMGIVVADDAKRPPKAGGRSKKNQLYAVGDLRLIQQEAKKAKEPTYNFLVKYNYIKNPVSEFSLKEGPTLVGPVPNSVS